MKVKFRILCLLSMVSMSFTMFFTTALAVDLRPRSIGNPDNYTDIQGHWAQIALDNVISNGIMSGTTLTTASPDNYITRQEMAALLVRVFETESKADISRFTDVNPNGWSYELLQKAVAMGILQGNGNSMRPTAHITKQEAATIFARAFCLYGYEADLTGYTDYNRISLYAQEPMSKCVSAKMIMPDSQNQLNPTKELTRAEFAAMIYSLVQFYSTSKVNSISNETAGSALFSAKDITLSDTHIAGNLYITDSVGTERVELSNVSVDGYTYVRCSGTLVLSNYSTIVKLVLCNPNAQVVVDVDDTSEVYNTIVTEQSVGAILKGTLGDLEVETNNPIVIDNGVVGILSSKVESPNITINAGSVVEYNTLNSSSTSSEDGPFISTSQMNIGGNSDVVQTLSIMNYNPVALKRDYGKSVEDFITDLSVTEESNSTITVNGIFKTVNMISGDYTYSGYYLPLRLVINDINDNFILSINGHNMPQLDEAYPDNTVKVNILLPFTPTVRIGTVEIKPISENSKYKPVTLTIQLGTKCNV